MKRLLEVSSFLNHLATGLFTRRGPGLGIAGVTEPQNRERLRLGGHMSP